MNQWADNNGKGLRVASPNFDARKPQTVKDIVARIRSKLDAAQNVRMHISLPCTCWSSWGRVNAAKSPNYRMERDHQQAESRMMLRHVMTILTKFQGERFGASFEWLASCDGFNESLCPEIKKLKQLLPYATVVDGFAYGMKSPSGVPMKKPWHILSNCPGMLKNLNERCPRHVAHDRIQQNLTKTTERYPAQFVKSLIARLLTRPPLGSGQEVCLTDPI
jgi:hypothetical protein